jgi:alcohol dehydrogenase (cytochrome c)
MSGGSSVPVRIDGQAHVASIKAIEVGTGNLRWKTELDSSLKKYYNFGGVLSTAGGVVFAGFNDEFRAFDADTGSILWRIRLGGLISAPPISYAVDGRQFVAVLAGNALFVFTVPNEHERSK